MFFFLSLTHFLSLSPDQAREKFKARVNEVAYIKADSKVCTTTIMCVCVCVWRADLRSVIVCQYV